jgi:hypothetical protein
MADKNLTMEKRDLRMVDRKIREIIEIGCNNPLIVDKIATKLRVGVDTVYTAPHESVLKSLKRDGPDKQIEDIYK